MTPPVALTVAGSDSGGAAGIAADLATFAALGVHGACVVTAVTAQDTTGVHDVHPVPVSTVASQLDAVLDDLPVAAIKTGMLGTPAAVECLGARYEALTGARPHLVVDPVLVATSGSVLGDESVRDAYVECLLPLAAVVTPNGAEARALAGAAGIDATLPAPGLAAALAGLGPVVVLTGGGEPVVTGAGGRHDTPSTAECVDWIAAPGGEAVPLSHPAVSTDNDHGTGCTFSSALAAYLAHGRPLAEAVRAAVAFTTGQLRTSSTWDLGRGRGPVAHTIPSSSTTDEPGDSR